MKMNDELRNAEKTNSEVKGKTDTFSSGKNPVALGPKFRKSTRAINQRLRLDGTTLEASETREKLIDGIRRFLLPGHHTIKEAYIKTLKKHFITNAELFDSSDVRPLQEIADTQYLPTVHQFTYLYYKMKRMTNPTHRNKIWRFRTPCKIQNK